MGLKRFSDNITAIVSVADDGGSSGRLREATGILPPGDIRQCLVALSEAEGLTGRLFQYRFSDEYGLSGHNFGNLFIAAMTDVTGSFEQGVIESSLCAGRTRAGHPVYAPASDPVSRRSG